MDKIMLIKHQGKYYSTGSYCGFDYTNLATGALIGEKLICPTCGSTYDIKNGYVDQGPSLRSISSFVCQVRDGEVKVTVPEHIPAFARKKMLKREKIDPRNMVIIGDSETALAAVDGLRTSFTGQITLIPCSPYGAFENLDVLRRKFSPLSKNEVHFLEETFMDKANVTILKGDVKNIDIDKK
jgi:apoptosis-inducing factor 3